MQVELYLDCLAFMSL